MLRTIANALNPFPAIMRALTYSKMQKAGIVPAGPGPFGVAVTPESSLTSSPVFAAVRIISTAVAGLPLTVYRRGDGDSRESASEHPSYSILHDAPNPESDSFVWWSAFVVQMLLHGRGAAEIERDEGGNPVALWLIPGAAVTPVRDEMGNRLYRVMTATGPVYLTPDRTFYVPYFSFDGVAGKGVIEFARESIGLNKSMEQGAAALFANMVRPSGALEAPPGFSDEARENLRKSVTKINSGAANVGRLLFLEDGVKYNPFTPSNQDAQWIEGRGFGIQETARFFNISPTKLADLGRATWSNLASENSSFIETTLRPILIPIEQQARTKLISERDRGTFYVETLIEARLRGLTADRYGAYETAIRAGFMLPSEARRMENLPAIPGLDDRPRPGQTFIPPTKGNDGTATTGNEG